MKTIVVPDPAAAAEAAAARLASEIAAAVRARGACCIALSGGRTPWQMLEALAVLPVAWRALHVFQVDERMVPFDDERRTARRIRELLVRPGLLPEAQFHAIPADDPAPAHCALDYAEELMRYAGRPPVLDVVQLGLGQDGHTASLVPEDPLLDVAGAETGISGLYQGTRRFSLTFTALNRARSILWLVTGRDKAAILRRLVEGDATIPAARVARAQATVITDAAAAVCLRNEPERHG